MSKLSTTFNGKKTQNMVVYLLHNIGVSSNAPDFLDCTQSVEIAVTDK
jgi:hypothetical protein